MDYGRQNKIQGRNMVFFKAFAYSISFYPSKPYSIKHLEFFDTPETPGEFTDLTDHWSNKNKEVEVLKIITTKSQVITKFYVTKSRLLSTQYLN